MTKDKNRPENTYNLPEDAITETEWFPVFKTLPTNGPIAADKYIVGFSPSPANRIDEDEEYFWLEVKTDSMIEERIKPGDQVLVQRQSNIENGDKGVFIVNNKEIVINTLYKGSDHFKLQPANENYDSTIVSPENIRIIGKVVAMASYDTGL